MSTLNAFKKRGKRKQANPLASFKQELQRDDSRKGQQVIFHSSREEKMSAVLLKFVEPYMQYADTEDAYHKLLVIAIAAWNAALVSPEERQKMISSLIKEMRMGIWERRDFRGIIEEMIERKLGHFAENKRLIVNYELQDLGDKIHLSIASTLAVQEEEDSM